MYNNFINIVQLSIQIEESYYIDSSIITTII